jgi:hypothetical protein
MTRDSGLASTCPKSRWRLDLRTCHPQGFVSPRKHNSPSFNIKLHGSRKKNEASTHQTLWAEGGGQILIMEPVKPMEMTRDQVLRAPAQRADGGATFTPDIPEIAPSSNKEPPDPINSPQFR